MNLKNKPQINLPQKGKLYRACAPRDIYFATSADESEILSLKIYDPKTIILFIETKRNVTTSNISHKCLYKNQIGFLIGDNIIFKEQKN